MKKILEIIFVRGSFAIRNVGESVGVLLLSILVLCFGLNQSITFADVVDYIPHKMTVKFEQGFSTNNPQKFFSVVIDDDYNFPNIRPIEKGTQVYFELVNVSEEKRAKSDAYIQARIVKAYIPSSDTTLIVKNPKAIVKISKYEELVTTDKALDTGISIANHFVKNLTYPAQFVRGVVQNNEGNPLKSGLNQVYKSSPLSYIDKGEPLDLQAGDLATLTFYSKIKNNNLNSDEEQGN